MRTARNLTPVQQWFSGICNSSNACIQTFSPSELHAVMVQRLNSLGVNISANNSNTLHPNNTTFFYDSLTVQQRQHLLSEISLLSSPIAKFEWAKAILDSFFQ
jgi:hypothetical protein